MKTGSYSSGVRAGCRSSAKIGKVVPTTIATATGDIGSVGIIRGREEVKKGSAIGVGCNQIRSSCVPGYFPRGGTKRIIIRVQACDDTGIYIRLGATITIRDGITITLTNIDESQVKLGIKAPKDMKIDREINKLTKKHD